MAQRPDETAVLMPLLDRLTTLTPTERESRDEHLRPVARLKKKLARDLEWLFNTRADYDFITRFAAYKEAAASVMNYGLPDVTNLSMANVRDRQRLEKAIEYVINVFEPRLTGVKVKLASQPDAGGKRIRFHIDAILKMDPIAERIAFDTELDVLSGQYEVKGESGAG